MALNLLLAQRAIQNERQSHAGLAQLLSHVVGGGRDVFVGQAVAATRGWLRKQAIGVGLGDLERLLRPIGGRTCLPRADLVSGDMSDQIGGDALRVSFELVDELGVPEVMKVASSEPGG